MDEIVLSAPEGATGISFAGTNYEVVDGLVTLPAEAHAALTDLRAHGFVPAPAPEAAAPVAPASTENAGAGDDTGAANTNAAPSAPAAPAGLATPP